MNIKNLLSTGTTETTNQLPDWLAITIAVIGIAITFGTLTWSIVSYVLQKRDTEKIQKKSNEQAEKIQTLTSKLDRGTHVSKVVFEKTFEVFQLTSQLLHKNIQFINNFFAKDKAEEFKKDLKERYKDLMKLYLQLFDCYQGNKFLYEKFANDKIRDFLTKCCYINDSYANVIFNYNDNDDNDYLRAIRSSEWKNRDENHDHLVTLYNAIINNFREYINSLIVK